MTIQKLLHVQLMCFLSLVIPLSAGADEKVVLKDGPAPNVRGETKDRHSVTAHRKSDENEPPKVSPRLKWNDTSHSFDVALVNDSNEPLKVLGAQTTAGFYVASLPSVAPAKGEAVFSVLYLAQPGTTADDGLLRVLTSKGERVVVLKNEREQAIHIDAYTLAWQVGDAPEAKTVTITVRPNTAVPKAVQAMGRGTRATLEKVNATTYRISITPASTEQPSTFPVFVTFDQQIVGVGTVIACEVTAKKN